MHLRKAKLMFFYVRYPSSAVLKDYFPDVKFNKNNTAQLVKWFSNFRWAFSQDLYCFDTNAAWNLNKNIYILMQRGILYVYL